MESQTAKFVEFDMADISSFCQPIQKNRRFEVVVIPIPASNNNLVPPYVDRDVNEVPIKKKKKM